MFLRSLPVLISIAHFILLAFLAVRHPFGNFATETDFYHYYAPDAEHIAAGQFPQNTFQGPGYPAMLALVAKLTGMSQDLFTVGKWMSVVCAVGCGYLLFLLFARLANEWVGIGAQLIAIVSGEFPQFSINAATDVFFLLLCLAVLVVFLSRREMATEAQRHREEEKVPLWLYGRVVLAGALAGSAYVVRYNGLFLLAVCGFGIVAINYFDRSWRDRIILAALLVLAFSVAASPWLIANARHHGSPIYNTNYLNIATEYFPELVAGKTNQDATRALSQKFQSFGDVWRYDAGRLLSQYPVNLYESLRTSLSGVLVFSAVGWIAWLGVLLALGRNRSKALWVVLAAGAIYVLLVSLTHWETRYYFFLMALYAGFAAYGVWASFQLMRNAGWMQAKNFAVFPMALVVALASFSFAASRQNVAEFLSGHPYEILAARDYLASVGASGKRIVARKPHLPYLSHNEWVFFPQVKSLDEFRAWVASNQVDYIAIGKRELKERKELKPLGDPKKAPAWLHPVWIHEDPQFILYRPELVKE